jgi:Na+/proline symporter
MDFNFHLSFIPTIVLIICLVVIYKQREVNESNLGWKIVGYSFLGGFHLNLNDLWLPIGIIIFFVLFRPDVNRKAKRYAALTGFVFMLMGKILPYL